MLYFTKADDEDGWLVVFNVPSTARSFRDGTPINCPLMKNLFISEA